MKICGFSFIRNAIKYDYPIREALMSIEPLCDALLVAVGEGEDDTLAYVKEIFPKKTRILETKWDDSKRDGGEVLAIETNKAFDAVPEDFDWCIYIQGDEAIHEQGFDELRSLMTLYKDDDEVEGILLKYHHFYGSYDYTGDTRGWYRNEIRIIKNDKSIRSYRDAQGFRKNGRKLKVVTSQVYVHHYGYVRHPEHLQQKVVSFNRLWHSDEWIDNNVPKVDAFDYSEVESLSRFKGTHPVVMQSRINAMNWEFSFDPTRKKLSTKEWFSRLMEKWFNWRPGEYKNYTVVRR